MNLHTLSKTTTKSKKRLGQGHGSGRVKTSGRGTKGQKARGKIPARFEGGALPLIKRLPFLRGKERNKSLRPNPVVINLTELEVFPAKSIVTIEALIQQKLVNAGEAKKSGVKILGSGELKNPLTIKLPISNSAAEKVKKAGGTIEL